MPRSRGLIAQANLHYRVQNIDVSLAPNVWYLMKSDKRALEPDSVNRRDDDLEASRGVILLQSSLCTKP